LRLQPESARRLGEAVSIWIHCQASHRRVVATHATSHAESQQRERGRRNGISGEDKA
jgi:hypothetical protein